MKQKKVLKSITPKTKMDTISLRILDVDYAKIKAKAEQYAAGNVSEFIRYAALNFIPTEKDLI
jgi:hypothetical protein